jgi:hypothetical protein
MSQLDAAFRALEIGDVVLLTVGEQTIEAQVLFASTNGRSVMLEFDGSVSVGGGFVLAMLPVLLGDDGAWSEIVTGSAVDVRRRRRPS